MDAGREMGILLLKLYILIWRVFKAIMSQQSHMTPCTLRQIILDNIVILKPVLITFSNLPRLQSLLFLSVHNACLYDNIIARDENALNLQMET